MAKWNPFNKSDLLSGSSSTVIILNLWSSINAGFLLRNLQDKKDKDGKEKILEEEVEPAPVMRIIKLNTPEWPYLLFGSVAGMVNGLFPFAFALVLSEILTVSRAY